MKHIFIVGCGHSGTTLMASMIGSHNQVHLVTRETSWFFDYDKLSKELNSVVKQAYANNCSFVLEKTPRHIIKINEIFKEFPDSKVIAMIRDPRDVSCSIMKRTGSLSEGYERWVFDNSYLLKSLDNKNVKVVSYEDLIENPDEVLLDVSDFIGIEYSEELLNYHEKEFNWFNVKNPIETDGVGAGAHETRRAWQMRQPIHDRRYIYKKELTEDMIHEVEDYCSRIMAKLGY